MLSTSLCVLLVIQWCVANYLDLSDNEKRDVRRVWEKFMAKEGSPELLLLAETLHHVPNWEEKQLLETYRQDPNFVRRVEVVANAYNKEMAIMDNDRAVENYLRGVASLNKAFHVTAGHMQEQRRLTADLLKSVLGKGMTSRMAKAFNKYQQAVDRKILSFYNSEPPALRAAFDSPELAMSPKH